MKQWAVVLLAGLLLMVIALPTSDKRSGSKSGTAGTAVSEFSAESSAQSTELENKLSELLSCTEGVGKTRVLLMTGSSGSFYSDGGTKVTGVLIAAEGADDPVTVQKIQQAVMALFQIEAHKIKIMKMK